MWWWCSCRQPWSYDRLRSKWKIDADKPILEPKLLQWRQRIIWGTAGQANMGDFGVGVCHGGEGGQRLYGIGGGLWRRAEGSERMVVIRARLSAQAQGLRAIIVIFYRDSSCCRAPTFQLDMPWMPCAPSRLSLPGSAGRRSGAKRETKQAGEPVRLLRPGSQAVETVRGGRLSNGPRSFRMNRAQPRNLTKRPA